MNRLIIFICCTVFVPTAAAVAGVSNIKQMNRVSNDNFDVTCLNGALETVNSKTILDNSVCKTATDKPFLASNSVACTGGELSNQVYITKISDNKKLGDGNSLSFKVCQQAVRASNSEVVCTGNEVMDWFHITRISDGEKLGSFGEKLSFKVCQQAVKASAPAFVCTGSEFMDWFHITRISDGKKLGERLSFENCLRLSSGSE